MKKFSEEFVWGTSTAAYQIEGGCREDQKGESIWDRFTHIPGNVRNGDTGDEACDSYHRPKEDAQLSSDLGAGGYRFSISWSRVMPNGHGEVNEAGMRYYETLIDELLKRGVEPYVTLYHWDLPQKLQDEGGWANRKTAEYFRDFAEVMFQRFKGKVTHWTTLNEPWVVSFVGNYTGDMAPGIRDFSTALSAAHTLLLGHGMVVRLFREMNMEGEIGITLNLSPKAPLTEKAEDAKAAVRCDGYMNRWFLDPVFKGKYPEDMLEWYKNKGVILPEIQKGDMAQISEQIDFLGINYYNIDYTVNDSVIWPIELRTGLSGGHPVTYYNMPITPVGIYELLMRINQDYTPAKIYISENGASFQDIPGVNGEILDEYRIDYLYRHLNQCWRAIQDGVPLEGYFVWSLMDNFEWNTGYANQFGLIYVDRKTLKRTKKKSFEWYRNVILKNGIDGRGN
jgi:beta-glucosidase